MTLRRLPAREAYTKAIWALKDPTPSHLRMASAAIFFAEKDVEKPPLLLLLAHIGFSEHEVRAQKIDHLRERLKELLARL